MNDEPQREDEQAEPDTPEAGEGTEQPGAPETPTGPDVPEPPEPDTETPEEDEAPEEEGGGAGAEPEAPSGPGTAEATGGAESELPPGADLDPIALEPEAELSAEERARLEAEAEERARLEAEATEDRVEEEPAPAPRTPAEMAGDARYLATGKRKRSIARVTLTPGDGKFEINRRQLDQYFPRSASQSMAKQPLVVTGYEGTVDVRVRVHGGGVSGQAGAVRHGIARALTEIDPALRRDLKRRGFLSRDSRVKERRKAGLKKARKRPQFSKR